MDPITGMPVNVVTPLPPGAKSSSPMDVASANMAASTAKMSSLINATHGGSKHYRKHNRKHNTLKGGASSLVVQPLHVPYPGGDALQGINTQMTSIGAQNVANSKYDNDWNKTGGKRSYKRTNKRRTNKRTNKRRTNKRSSRRYKKM